jgi:ABC-type sugar transport system substrate-binding protein
MDALAVQCYTTNKSKFRKASTMMKRTVIIAALATALTLSAGVSIGANQQETVYGSQIMTQQERNEYRTKMRAAKTAEEREQIRKVHHERMKERAKALGITLPDEPPARGGGMGPGGGGMGPGGGRGR